MIDEDAALKETIKHLGEASRRVQASRRLIQRQALVGDSNHPRLVARPSEAPDTTEVARRDARRRRDAG